VAGYACYKPNLYDGTMVYHYAHIRRHRLHTSSDFDLASRERDARGLYVPGQYLCYQESAPPC